MRKVQLSLESCQKPSIPSHHVITLVMFAVGQFSVLKQNRISSFPLLWIRYISHLFCFDLLIPTTFAAKCPYLANLSFTASISSLEMSQRLTHRFCHPLSLNPPSVHFPSIAFIINIFSLARKIHPRKDPQ